MKDNRITNELTRFEFKDFFGDDCSIKETGSVKPRISIGLDDCKPMILASKAGENGVYTEETEGWINYPIPEDVSVLPRIHLTKKQVKKLLPILEHFAKTGRLPLDLTVHYKIRKE